MPTATAMRGAAAAARDLAWVGRHEAAIALCTQALSDPALTPAERIDWLDARADSLTAQGELVAAATDARAMLEIATATPSPSCRRRRSTLWRSR
jgi:hypothetical protein